MSPSRFRYILLAAGLLFSATVLARNISEVFLSECGVRIQRSLMRTNKKKSQILGQRQLTIAHRSTATKHHAILPPTWPVSALTRASTIPSNSACSILVPMLQISTVSFTALDDRNLIFSKRSIPILTELCLLSSQLPQALLRLQCPPTYLDGRSQVSRNGDNSIFDPDVLFRAAYGRKMVGAWKMGLG